MDPRLLKYYNSELQYIREMGGEFAKEFPKIAGRLGLDGFECADPYVERLLEGFSFLSARLQVRLDSDYSRFTQHLLEMVYPHYLSPIPSMAIVQFTPDMKDGSLAAGMPIPKETVLRSIAEKNDPTECEYRTAHALTLWPIEIAEASYITNLGALPEFVNKTEKKIRAAIKLTLKTTAGLSFSQIVAEKLSFFIRGRDELPTHIYEQIFANCIGVAFQSSDAAEPFHRLLKPSIIEQSGFSNDQALIPYSGKSFQGYRLLQEYFAFPQRFLFFDLNELDSIFPHGNSEEIEVFFLFDKTDPFLENRVDASCFLLHCSPIINLFPKRGDRIFISGQNHEYHIVPDKTRPLDFEVYNLTNVVGHGKKEYKEHFSPLYEQNDPTSHAAQKAFYTIRREPRLLSTKQKKYGPRSSYVGSELFISLVDSREAPFSSDLRELEIAFMCTNRDLPLHMPLGKGKTDFKMISGLPIQSVRCVSGPTTPKPSHAFKETSWRLINHLTLNYLSLLDGDGHKNAQGLKEILNLYGDNSEPHIKKQIDGVVSVTSSPVTRRLPLPGPIAFGRGLEIKLLLEESAFEGLGSFVFGAVLDSFFKKYIAINSFSETVISTVERGEIKRWALSLGKRQII